MCVAEHDFMLQHPRKCREICTPRDDEEVSKTAAMAAKKALSKYQPRTAVTSGPCYPTYDPYTVRSEYKPSLFLYVT